MILISGSRREQMIYLMFNDVPLPASMAQRQTSIVLTSRGSCFQPDYSMLCTQIVCILYVGNHHLYA